jgi:hypothetical protein
MAEPRVLRTGGWPSSAAPLTLACLVALSAGRLLDHENSPGHAKSYLPLSAPAAPGADPR